MSATRYIDLGELASGLGGGVPVDLRGAKSNVNVYK